MDQLLKDIKNCNVCAPRLEFGTNPVVSAHPNSKIVVIGQAPGAVVHQSGIPWDDKSGDNLRQWMQVSHDTFYNPEEIALIPMGFCYPGKGKSGDLPPRKECAPLWHDALWQQMKEVKLILLIGTYAQQYYLQEQRKKTLTETVKNFEEYLPKYFVLPHPSPRNNIWRAKNPWFDELVIPRLRLELKDHGL
ncbi:uracil-DNA glycosylase family protein [Sinomicrobium sp. M5D2P17]